MWGLLLKEEKFDSQKKKKKLRLGEPQRKIIVSKCLKDQDFFQETYFIVYLIILMLN